MSFGDAKAIPVTSSSVSMRSSTKRQGKADCLLYIAQLPAMFI